MSDEMIIVDNVSKQYRINARGYNTLREDVYKLFRKFTTSNRSSSYDKNYIWALKDVSFTVRSGEILGIVGPNGAGKTTILKILSKITRPTNGTISTKGRLVSLIELGAGFHQEMTGRENIYLAGSIWGMKKKEIDSKFDSIVDFSENEQFLDTPLKRYSSGMRVRLGFSVAIHCNPEILLIDEVLAVGDFRFRDKCIKEMNKFFELGIPIILVSHHRYLIEKLCSRAILLHKGEIVCEGEPKNVLDKYYLDFSEKIPETVFIKNKESTKSKHVEITKVSLLGKDGIQKNSFLTEDEMKVHVYYKSHSKITGACFYCRIGRDNYILHATSNPRADVNVDLSPGETGFMEVKYKNINLLEGNYYLNVGILPDFFQEIPYDKIDNAISFQVSSRIDHGAGMLFLKTNWKKVVQV